MFIPHIYHKSVEPWELQEASEGLSLKVGHALAVTDGKVGLAAGTAKPQFICMQDCEQTVDGQMIHVERVRTETVYETELSVANEDIAVGGKFNIAAGETINATAGGSAEVVSFDGTAVGDKVRVRFV